MQCNYSCGRKFYQNGHGAIQTIFTLAWQACHCIYTLQAFEQAKSVDEIILVCRDEDKEQLNTCVHMAGITKPVIFTLGGTSRQQSVFSGVRACASQTEYIIIHDGARPLITWDLIEKVTADAFTYGAAALGFL